MSHSDTILDAVGFVLCVLALGTVLTCRPPVAFVLEAKGYPKMDCRQVFWLVGLFVLLNLYDLVCTLHARAERGLLEMNPLVATFLDVPAMIVCFKLGLTVCPAILLIVARYSRLAQMVSWWVVVLYTVLIIRWIAYNGVLN